MELTLPRWVEEIPEKDEFVRNLLKVAAFREMMFYKRKIEFMEKKWKGSFNRTQQREKRSKNENFELWDDLILWEGYELRFKEWEKRYRATK